MHSVVTRGSGSQAHVDQTQFLLTQPTLMRLLLSPAHTWELHIQNSKCLYPQALLFYVVKRHRVHGKQYPKLRVDTQPHATHHDGAKRKDDSGLKERCGREVEDSVGQDDHVRPRDEGDISRDSTAELIAERSYSLDEALEALYALLVGVMIKS